MSNAINEGDEGEMDLLLARVQGVVRTKATVWGESSLEVEALLPGDPVPEREALFVVSPRVFHASPGHFISFGRDGAVLRRSEGSGLHVWHPGFLSFSRHISLWRPVRVGVLTVSDKGSRGERRDTAGPALETAAKRIGGEVVCRQVVPDEEDVLVPTLSSWADKEGCHLILVTGGTGLSLRDRTPEALEALATRSVPGLGEAMRRITAVRSSRAPLSRGGAILRGQTLILALPGSERGAVECFLAVAPLLRHGVEIAQGWEGECGGHGHS